MNIWMLHKQLNSCLSIWLVNYYQQKQALQGYSTCRTIGNNSPPLQQACLSHNFVKCLELRICCHLKSNIHYLIKGIIILHIDSNNGHFELGPTMYLIVFNFLQLDTKFIVQVMEKKQILNAKIIFKVKEFATISSYIMHYGLLSISIMPQD